MMTSLVALVPILGALVPGLLPRRGRSTPAVAAAAVSAVALLLLALMAPAVWTGETVTFSAPWIPQFDMRFSFFLDGLGLVFAALILGMGLLIIGYARFYLGAHERLGRFYSYLLLFQGAMLGIVLSDNIILMLVFWELTSLSSFLLIGYWHDRPESRQGARMALIVTGGGGLALIAGMLMLGEIAGSYELSEIIHRGDEVRASPLATPALVLILIGAFTKSAQFPFHFWLPHAMAAPTPVSAYLHSATMVKAGIFLLARLWPVFAGTDAWFLAVSLTGLITMVVAAWIALFKDDLKQLLAFSTVSHLGLITMLLGIGSRMALVAALFHLLNHAAFKAALFMSAGIVDHEAGTRDVRQLGGLRRLMPVTALLALTAAAAMAGMPLLNGFVSKEMMLEQASTTVYAGLPWLFPLFATIGALLSVAYSARLAIATFFGPVRHPAGRPPHDPAPGMWLPVAVLVIPVVAFGLLPALAEPIVLLAASAAAAAPLAPVQFAIWHGLTPALGMSLVASVGGLLLLVAGYQVLFRARQTMARPDAKRIFDSCVRIGTAGAGRLTDALHSDGLPRYAGIIIAAVIGIGLYGYWGSTHGPGTRPPLDLNGPAAVAWAALLAACLVAVLRHRDRLLMLVVTAVAGLVVSLLFLQFSAPDLALTQISVEVVATILLLSALNLLPKTTPDADRMPRVVAHGTLAAAAGAAVAWLGHAVLTRDFDTISGYHLAEAKPGGGGTNVVNVILVDFRGYDTFGEIIVLGIAGLAIFALLESARGGWPSRKPAPASMAPISADAHPLILVVAARILLPLTVTAGIYIFLRGHNLPGGGFIAGLVVAVAFIMQYIANGYAWAQARARINPQMLIGAGVILAGLTGVGSWLFGAAFLTSSYGYFDLPLLGTIELTTVLAFDTGVFLTVVGTTQLALVSIAQLGAPGEARRPEAPAPRRERPRAPVPARAREQEPA